MSVLTNRNILIVGEENSQIYTLKESLEAHGAIIKNSTCNKVDVKLINELNIDLIILNHLEHSPECTKTLRLLQEPLVERAIPVFVLVKDDQNIIHEALLLGIADYITQHEDEHSVLAKIKAVFGHDEIFAGNTDIDISPLEDSVTATGIRVFVVEDDPLLRNLLSVKMDRSLFPYEFSNDGKNVIPAMQQFKPDVIILDLMLPGRSGFEVLAEVKADEKLKDVPVIVFSNRDGQEDRQKAQELGATGFYVKAMTDLSELMETIESLVK